MHPSPMNPLSPISEPRFHLHLHFEPCSLRSVLQLAKLGRNSHPDNVIWHLTEEATSVEIEDSINKSNAAMMAATSKPKEGKGKGR